MFKTKLFCGAFIFAAACGNNPPPGQLAQAKFRSANIHAFVPDNAIQYQSVFDMLSRTPGVRVVGNRVIVRGYSSINGYTDPLIVVDGIALTENVSAYTLLGMMNPRDIAKIEVLDDADTVLWASSAAHGVISITTRRQ